MHLPTALFTFLSLPLLAHSARPKKDAILLSKVETLTFRGNGAKTTSRRVSPIPQLKCVSNSRICALHEPEVLRCTNQGSSYGDEDIEWSCTASLPRELKLGSTEVICEGYKSSDDPYVLKGSCGVEYTLVLTDEGEQRYPDIAKGSWFGGGGAGNSGGANWVFIFIFLAVLGWIIYSARERAAGRDPIRGGGRRPGDGGGGGGGWGPGWGGGPDDNDPPPPYPGAKPSVTAQAGWRPGFWSGLAGGAAAGYMAGGRRNNNDSRGSSRFGSNYASSSGSGSFSSGSRHQSTGFGSTSRR
ncbi:SOCE-associated regulatory factor of calcium homoeostasis domain-containing protein [Sarocladium implicatum]|nr:SOCE-associated regulatory factor of calcium homoeostasis domain-containing protein [Sarocladium implicatum]